MMHKAYRKRFWTPDGFYVTERVGRIGENENALQEAIPSDAGGVFLFRVDADCYCEQGQRMILDLAKKYNIKTTWFVNIQGHINHPQAIEQLLQDELVEVQSHGYEHKVFKTLEDNLKNLKKAEDYLAGRINRKIRGVAAPYGAWNIYYQNALEKLNHHYSSDFSAGYDQIPFYPRTGSKASTVLQMPVHPVCNGSFIYSKLSGMSACEYFENIIRIYYLKRLPIALYGHPNEADVEYNRRVLDHIFKIISSIKDMQSVSFGDYYSWWTGAKRQESRRIENVPIFSKIILKRNITAYERITGLIKCIIAEIKLRLRYKLRGI